MIKIKALKRIIASKGYQESRMERMHREVLYYTNLANSAHNSALRAAFASTARMYLARYEYYLKKAPR